MLQSSWGAEFTDVAALAVKVAQWDIWDAKAVAASQALVMPMCFDDGRLARDWVLLVVSPAAAGDTFASASALRCDVYDRVGRAAKVDELVDGLRVILATVSRCELSRQREVRQRPFPKVQTDHDTAAVVLGLLMCGVGGAAGEPVLDETADLFTLEVSGRVRSAFNRMYAQAERLGPPLDVLRQFGEADPCRMFLRSFGESVDDTARSRAAAGDVQGIRVVDAKDDDRWVVLTWNLANACGAGQEGWKSVQAPEKWSLADQLCAQAAELRRWKPHVFAVQECVDDGPYEGLSTEYAFVAAVPSHCGFTHLYARRSLKVELELVSAEHRFLVARAVVGRVDVAIVAAHLVPSSDAGKVEERRSAVAAAAAAVASYKAVLFMGDFNVRQDEVHAWQQDWSFRDATYDGFSWSPVKMQFYSDWQDRGAGFSFDRILFRGELWVSAYLVADSRIFAQGERFALSDHAAVLGYVDVHPCYAQASTVGKRTAEDRRGALARLRNQSCLLERCFIAERFERDRATAVLSKDEAAQRALADVIDRAREEAKARAVRRKALLDAITGDGNLFSTPALSGAAPLPPPHTVALPAYDGLSCLGAPAVWANAVVGGYPPVANLCDPGLKYGYVLAVAQLLLRLPAVAVWLDKHRALVPADSACPCGPRCEVCLLVDARQKIGVKDAIPRLVPASDAVLARDAGHRQSCDAAVFFRGFLGRLRAAEVCAGRSTPGCNVVDPPVTHVDRIFGFPFEERRQCARWSAGRLVR